MPSAAAIAILEFGKLIHTEASRPAIERDPKRTATAEQRLIEMLSTDDNPLLKPGLLFHVSRPLDQLVLRVLALTSYLQLCTNFRVAVGDVAIAVAEDEPARILEARQTITQLLYIKRLLLQVNSDDQLELGTAMRNLLAGGSTKLPLQINACELHRQWRRNEAEATKRKAKESIVTLKSAKQLAATISEHVIGLDAEVRTFASRLALHQRRAAMLRAGADPGTPNEVLLFVGPSGCGKTWLAETAGRVCGLPFGAISASDLTAEGYVGLSLDDAVKTVVNAANNDAEKARYGILFADEFDKKRSSGSDYGSRDVGGAAVQQAVLRLVEGTEFQVGGRRGGFDLPFTINTRGMFFTFAGAFVGLDQLLTKRGVHGIGFGGRKSGSNQRYLYDALIDFGLIPEFVNRLTGVLSFPAPTVEQLVQIAERAIIPAYRTLLASTGADLQISAEAVRAMAESAQATGTFARGIKSIVARLVEDAVYEERVGLISLGGAEVKRAITAAGLAATSTE